MLVDYYGTTESTLSEFKFKVMGIGECHAPANGIWLSQRIEGAQYHAILVKDKRGTSNGYVYKVTLMPCTKISDATQSSLSDELFENYRSTRPLFMRPFITNKNWYSQLTKGVGVIKNKSLRPL